MGCFSFLCKECGKGIRSNSFSGEKCELFLLDTGAVIQHMSGQYDSYGRVFIEGTQSKKVKHGLMESQKWNLRWGKVCDLMFDDDPRSGIAAYHSKCWKGNTPESISEGDPNQGWGEEDEDECLMANIDQDYKYD